MLIANIMGKMYDWRYAKEKIVKDKYLTMADKTILLGRFVATPLMHKASLAKQNVETSVSLARAAKKYEKLGLRSPDPTVRDFYRYLEEVSPNMYRDPRNYVESAGLYLAILGLQVRSLKPNTFDNVTMLLTDKRFLLTLMKERDLKNMIATESAETVWAHCSDLLEENKFGFQN